MPKNAVTDEEIANCLPVLLELRPHLHPASFLPLVRQMEKEGFHIAFMEENHEVVTVAGYRLATNLVMGKNLYVDDLVTSERVRFKGYGAVMLSWLRNVALDNGCRYLHLDSGTHRHQAHKFYFKQSLVIVSYHFGEELEAT